MSKKKTTPNGRDKKKPAVSLVRSSAAEYLTFVAASGQGGVEAVYANENVWLTQKMMGLLYDVDVRTISYHLKNVFADRELEENSVKILLLIFAPIFVSSYKKTITKQFDILKDQCEKGCAIIKTVR